MLAANFGRDQRGAVIVEVTIVLTFMFVLPRHRSQSPRQAHRGGYDGRA
jgi:hypothetical protein